MSSTAFSWKQFVLKIVIDKCSSLIPGVVCCQTGDRILPEPVMTYPTDVYMYYVCYQALLSYQGYPAKRALSAMRKHGG